MKKLILITLMLMLATPVLADQSKKYRSPVGIGTDVTIYQDKKGFLNQVNVEQRYDWQNGASSWYLVGSINLWKLFKK